uniref:3-beta hydroxysteroid dehydrogenase/isomerase domain-containing protein n=1 Tax=Romanomermis culicivorax TaxID=13658 RepID=A0A915KKH4_ROMCU
MYATEKEIVVITGGCGFLGQHLIREIQLLWADKVKEIRVVDKQIYQKFLNYPDKVPVVECIADCAIEKELIPFFDGATTVFHMAARPYNFDMYPNKKGFKRDNYDGTAGVISAMLACNVPYLIYTSDAMGSLASEDSQAMSELAIGDGPASKSFILDAYGETKCSAQRLVRLSNGKSLKNGKPLSTIVVSPTALYGEGDSCIIPHALRLCKQYGYIQRLELGSIQLVNKAAYTADKTSFSHIFGNKKELRVFKAAREGDGVSVLSMTYAGNAAYMHLLAADKLRENSVEFGSEVFLCSEYTRPINYFQYIKPFVEQAGYKISRFSLSFLTAWFLLFFLEIFFGFFHLFFNVQFPHNLPNSKIARLVGGYYFHFNCTKARLVLDYKPKYQPAKAMEDTVAWWKLNYKSYC